MDHLTNRSPATQNDTAPLVQLTAEWEAAWVKMINASAAPEGGNFDTPECVHWMGKRNAIAEMIKATPIASDDEAKALMRWIWLESSADYDDWPVVPRWALTKLMEWAGVADVIGHARKVDRCEAAVEDTEAKTPEARVARIAAAFDCKAPATLIADDNAPSQEVIEFCRDAGVSLDYIFIGDTAAMIRSAHSAQPAVT